VPLSLTDDLKKIKGVGPKIETQLNSLNIYTIEDLIFHLPTRYENKTKLNEIKDLDQNQTAHVEGEIVESKIFFPGRRSFLAKITDGTGFLNIRMFYFSQAQAKAFEKGKIVRAYGNVKITGSKIEMFHPSYKVFLSSERPSLDNTYTPVYPTVSGLTQFRLKAIIRQALSGLNLDDICMKDADGFFESKKINFPKGRDAISKIHMPSVDDDLNQLRTFKHPAQKRLIVEEFAANQIAINISSERINKMKSFDLSNQKLNLETFDLNIPFYPTKAQQKVVQEIMMNFQEKKPMRRLIQGDVGSGKTIVAAAAMNICSHNKKQSVLMCPTEVLAKQHFENFVNWFKDKNISIELLLGKTKKRDKEKIEKKLINGEIDILIGTHTVFQKNIEFKSLALIVVDEQQRFGVKQRFDLASKSKSEEMPHQLFMTATPIPRTLAMTIFSDLDLSIIDELPPGRNPVKTVVLSNDKRLEIVNRLQKVCKDGNQVYWLCTMIEDNDSFDVQSAETSLEWIRENAPELRSELVHSKLNNEAKEKNIIDFRNGLIDILVCTTVIEVGMDVPNASLMIIENAERLGLSQLHQLRGRVGRGPDMDSYCALLYQDPVSENAQKRLEAMKKHSNGFEISEIDLELRGAGELLGLKQSGGIDFKISDISRDVQLLKLSQSLAEKISNLESTKLEKLIDRWIGQDQLYIKAQ
jgi:ATP-dependent DNA helicase RecG